MFFIKTTWKVELLSGTSKQCCLSQADF